jgi:hypothetical protein
MNNTHIIGIYKIISPSGKIYIGQSQNILSNRLNHYINGNCSTQTKLYNSLKKYGFENHIFEIIEECSLEQLNEREIYWGLFYNVLNPKTGLNLKLGEKRGMYSEESKNKMSKSSLGKSKSQKHKINISKARLGMKFSKEHTDNMSLSRFKYSIVCLENNTTYKSAHQASKELNVASASIIKVCKGIYKQIKGYTFKFINDGHQ